MKADLGKTSVPAVGPCLEEFAEHEFWVLNEEVNGVNEDNLMKW